MHLKRLLPSCLALFLLLSSCSHTAAEVTPTAPEAPSLPTRTPVSSSPAPSATSTPEYTGARNPLTGEPIADEWVNRRPVAIMLNNLKQALPQQGQSAADIVYEVLAEGGITRMLGVYQSLEGVGTIGSIRSSRPYYLELALGHDAVYIHAGGSEDAYEKIKTWGVTSLDGVRGPYMSNTPQSNLMWRDPTRKKTMSSEHTVVTTGAQILKLFPTYAFRQEHKSGYRYDMDFADDGTPDAGASAKVISVVFSNYKTGKFVYDEDSGHYKVEEYGKAYIDGNSGEQVSVTNVVVLRAPCKSTGDSYGHVTVDLSDGGTGYFACGGKVIDLLWSKSYPDGQFRYTDLEGNPIIFGRGHTYVSIIPADSSATFS